MDIVTVKGKAVHASTAEQGINAIQYLLAKGLSCHPASDSLQF